MSKLFSIKFKDDEHQLLKSKVEKHGFTTIAGFIKFLVANSDKLFKGK